MCAARPVVLLTGAAGRLGRAIAIDLGDELDLRLLDRSPATDLPGLLVADITDPAALDRVMPGVDVVLHFAGDARPAASYADLRVANADGTYEVLAAAVRHGVGKVVFASSNRVVEAASPLRRPGGGPAVLRVDHAAAPDTLYGASKAYGEALAAHFAHAHGLRVVSLRLGSVDPAPDATVADKPQA